MFYHARPQLASELANALSGRTLFSDAPNGLFLAAPRRTGKSSFLQNELRPALEKLGALVVYVDLWADARRNPGSLIVDAIAQALQSKLGRVAKAAKAAGLENVNLAGWLKIDTSRIGELEAATLVDALRLLIETAKSPIALIIDEAQHALTSAEGEQAMTALKSARDQLNTPKQTNLMLIMSGSDRDKLLRLVNGNGAPFYGSQVQRMPELGADFIDHVAQVVESARSLARPLDRSVLTRAFALFGNRPQFLIEALGQLLSPLASLENPLEEALFDAAAAHQQREEQQLESEFQALKPLEKVVLWRLLEQGPHFRPYDADALKFYHHITQQPASAAKVQRALENLRERTPALVWKSARGEYAVEDAAMQRWYQRRLEAKQWPP